MSFFSNAAYLPPASQPPHDPRRLPLNAKTGWRIAHTVNLVSGHCGELSLDLKPVAKRSPAEASGAFGGLVMPKYLAYTADCGVLLLDQKNAKLKKFDPCSCQFITVPCTGGSGSGIREFNAPAAIAICGDSLLVADTGNRRVMVYSLLGFLVRGIWMPPFQSGEQI
jgi:hypothetical protein